MATFAQIGNNVRKRTGFFKRNSTKAVKRVAKAGLREMVYATKADTGKARSNWRVGLGSPTRAVIDAYTPYPKGSRANGAGMAETANASAAIGAGNARIDSLRGSAGFGLTTAVFISNSIPYPNNAFTSGVLAAGARAMSAETRTLGNMLRSLFR